jgi:uncharacterized protein YkwD
MRKPLFNFFLSVGWVMLSALAYPEVRLGGCPSAETIEREMVDALKIARSEPRSCGKSHFKAAKPLRWSSVLFKAANRHAEDMSRKNYFGHDSPDGRSPADRIGAAGYSWGAYGENIAAGQGTVAEVVEEWLGSPEHCANIMNGEFVEVGVACAAGGGVEKTPAPYWVMVLARPLR